MSDNVQTAMFDILKSIQSELAGYRKNFDDINTRFDRLEEIIRKQRRDTAGLLVMAKAVTGDFAEELAAVQERITALEGERRI